MVHLSPFLDPAFGDPQSYRHQKGRRSYWVIALPFCKLSRRSVSTSQRYPGAVQNKKLSCRRETARYFVSLNILLSDSRSLKVIRNDTVEYRACVNPYQFFIETTYVEPFMRYSASKNGTTLKLGQGWFKVIENGAVQYVTFNWSAIVSIAVCCTIFKLQQQQQ